MKYVVRYETVVEADSFAQAVSIASESDWEQGSVKAASASDAELGVNLNKFRTDVVNKTKEIK